MRTTPTDALPFDVPLRDTEAAKVLVVDDQASNLEALGALLEQSDCELVRANSADEALLQLLDQDFAAIILDVIMPGMDGVDLAKIIKQRRRTRDIPILFLTAQMLDHRDVLRGYGVGAVDYLVKPVHSDILRSKIAVFIDLYRKTRALARANDALQHEMVARARIEEELREANQQLERRVLDRTDALRRADRRKDEFLASLAHELRNPLAPIRSAVEVLKSRSLGEVESEHARAVVVRQVEHMTRLIDDLLDVSRITNDKLVLQLNYRELGPIVANAVETSRPLIAERQHRLTVTLPPEPVTIHADPARLAQVVANLLTNAAKYTPPGGDLLLTADTRDAQVHIRIVDNGVGMDAELLPRIFELFVQGEPQHHASAGGLGIGLTLARRLVEMHGGTLSAESAGLGRGSAFIVRLPMPALPDDFEAQQMLPEADLHPALPRRVLIVDDNQDAADMLAVMMEAWGQMTRIAHDGPAALKAGAEFRPEIVLLDLGLPGLDGYETARQMRATEWGQPAILIAVTGWGRDSDIARGQQAGFDHHLVKPVSPEVLYTLVTRPDADKT
jgi:signal transduction histidine kinase